MAKANEQTEVSVPGYLKLSKVVVWFLYFWVLIGIISLFLRVILLAFSANQSASFTEFVMNVSNDYLAPFRGIFPPKEIGTTGYLDVSALFAIVVYLFIVWGISALIAYVQGKIDLTTAQQQQHIADQKRAQLIAAQKAQKPAPARTTTVR